MRKTSDVNSDLHMYAHTFEQTNKIHSYHTYKQMQKRRGGAWWHTLLIPALRQRGRWIFVSSSPARSTCQVPGQSTRRRPWLRMGVGEKEEEEETRQGVVGTNLSISVGRI